MRMTLVRKVAAAVTGLALAGTLAACGSDDSSGGSGNGGGSDDKFTTSLQMGTGGTGGVYYPLGNELATLFEKHSGIDGLSVSAVESGASVENLASIAQGKFQLGFTQNNTAFDAINDAGEFAGAGIDNVGLIGQLYPEAAQVITLESSGFESVSDLAGKTISTGPPGSGTKAVATAILAAYGLEDGDYTSVDESFGDARAKLQDGQIDASIEIVGVPGASVTELNATNNVKLLPVEGDAQAAVTAGSDFEAYTIPAGAYEFLDEPLETVSVFAMLVASTDQVSEEVAYELARVTYEHAAEISMAQGQLLKLEDALLGQGVIPLHPGAEKYYQEQGLL
jgi:uncharacterized protein